MRRQFFKILTLCMGLSAAGMQMQVYAQTPKENHILVFDNAGRLVAISGNAKWAAGYIGETAGYLVNLETEVVHQLLPDAGGWAEAWAIANDGTTFGIANKMPAYWDNEGIFQGYLPVPSSAIEGVVCGATADGQYVAGYIYTETGYAGVPLRWERQADGTYKYKKLPVRDKDLSGRKVRGGFTCDAFSKDGNMCAGRMIDYDHYWFPVVWKNLEKDEEPVCCSLEYMLKEDGQWSGWFGKPKGFTKDGKYMYGVLENKNDAGAPFYAAVVDIATNNTELKQTKGSLMGALLNNGDVITGEHTGTPFRNSFIDRPNGDSYALSDFLLKFYGLDMAETTLEQSGTIMGLSDDERSLVGFAGVGSGFGGFVYQLGDASADPLSIKEVQEASPVILSADGNITVKGASGYPVVVSDMAGKVWDTVVGTGTTVIPVVKGRPYIVKIVMDKVSYIKKVMVI